MSLHPDFINELRKYFTGDVRLDIASKILYSTDASIYQIEPLGVAVPKTQDDLQSAVELAAKYKVPILPRGAGSSLGGQAIGEALILDCSRWLDTIVEIDWAGLIGGEKNALAVQEVENPSAFGVVETNGDKITRLVEKPQHPPTNKAVVGVYYVRDYSMLLDATTEVVENGIRTHGEIQLTDAFELLLKKGAELYTFPTQAWYDCGRRETILATNCYLLEKSSSGAERVTGEGITPPVNIGREVTIEGSEVGPHVSIGPGSIVRNSKLKNLIVGSNCLIEDSKLKDSLIGDNATIRGFSGDLSLGDYSEITG